MQENIIPIITSETEKRLNSLFSNRPIQLLDIANSNKESIENINIKQFLKDSFINAEKCINKTYRNEIFEKYKNEGYYKQEKFFYDKTEQKNTCDIYKLEEKDINTEKYINTKCYNAINETNKSCYNENKHDTENKVLLQRYNIITGKGYYKDRAINRTANTHPQTYKRLDAQIGTQKHWLQTTLQRTITHLIYIFSHKEKLNHPKNNYPHNRTRNISQQIPRSISKR